MHVYLKTLRNFADVRFANSLDHETFALQSNFSKLSTPPRLVEHRFPQNTYDLKFEYKS